jgi:hypothetical protein
VAARTFEDSSGAVWEVFEVHRSSRAVGGVSGGLESGWLAFVSGERKRRLAPFPAGWEKAPVTELERLCAMARVAPPHKHQVDQPADGETLPATPGEVPASVEATVRAFAHRARARSVPAVDAMVELKALLARTYPDPSSEARDLRRVRRWFVEAYYFERDA